ncbi:AraC family transcriptional regulator [Gordonia sp. 'Campus']|uniref:AraC family transcriptional regulator n=1 Tax=Gordonia sp. 'Campus' TaxID=2915824 RepID=UPI001EE4D91F|nr:AraC family transcriptional regulator [Gordonia sp. 'Campus']
MRAADPFHTPDPLGEALHFFRLDGAFYCRSELTEPWALTMPVWEGCLCVHLVVSGVLRLTEPGGGNPRDVESGGDALTLGPGDLALVPHGRSHVITGARTATSAPVVTDLPHDYLSDRYAILRHGGDGPESTVVVCAVVRFDHPSARLLTALLPPVLHIRAGTERRNERSSLLAELIRLVVDEAGELRPGGEAVITRLSDVVVIHAIRSWLDDAPAAQTGWLAALADPQLGSAVAAVHREPAAPWTVERMAGVCAMSRSTFAARFTAVVGEPAMQYVTRWRMYVAADRLRDLNASVASVAGELGYSSEAAFSRAFRRINGFPPGQIRRELRAV